MRNTKLFIRKSLLAILNKRRLSQKLKYTTNKSTLVFFIFTDRLLHFLPFCLKNLSHKLHPFIILNGINKSDQDWVQKASPNTPIFSLRTSLSNTSNSLISHGEVLEALLSTNSQSFCIQDPDCFILDDSFVSDIFLNPENHFAAGPFTKTPSKHSHVLPDTFFLKLNQPLYNSYRKKYGITADATSRIPTGAKPLLSSIDYGETDYPEQFKGYFDTLQLFWLTALANGKSFNKIEGDGTRILHIGGTSYLEDTTYEPEHWDYWPISVQYINSLLLSLPQNKRFQPRFASLMNRFPTAQTILDKHPGFRHSHRFHAMNRLWESFRNIQDQ